MRLLLVTSITAFFAITTPALAAEFWVSQDPDTKQCTIAATMPDGKTTVMVGATSYPTKDEAKAARKAAKAAGQCVEM
jgi:hypothetical protein